MYQEDEIVWEGLFPYEVLAPAGITPDSSMKEVQEAMRYFMRQGQGMVADKAWHTLKKSRQRLVVDFFLYQLPMDG